MKRPKKINKVTVLSVRLTEELRKRLEMKTANLSEYVRALILKDLG